MLCFELDSDTFDERFDVHFARLARCVSVKYYDI